MEEESAFERQQGVLARRARRQAAEMPLDPLWERYMHEYQRMKRQGLSRREALEVFKPLLADPARKLAAELMLATAAG